MNSAQLLSCKEYYTFYVLSIEYTSRILVKYILLTPTLIQVLMAHTADITVSVSLAIILNSAEENRGSCKQIRYMRIATVPILYWLLDVSNPGKLFYQWAH